MTIHLETRPAKTAPAGCGPGQAVLAVLALLFAGTACNELVGADEPIYHSPESSQRPIESVAPPPVDARVVRSRTENPGSRCGAPEFTPSLVAASDWPQYACLEPAEADASWGSCLTREQYSIDQGTGCPGEQRCCPTGSAPLIRAAASARPAPPYQETRANRSSGTATWRGSSENYGGDNSGNDGSGDAYRVRSVDPYRGRTPGPVVRVRDYYRSDGTYVRGHLRGVADGDPSNNLGRGGSNTWKPPKGLKF